MCADSGVSPCILSDSSELSDGNALRLVVFVVAAAAVGFTRRVYGLRRKRIDVCIQNGRLLAPCIIHLWFVVASCGRCLLSMPDYVHSSRELVGSVRG